MDNEMKMWIADSHDTFKNKVVNKLVKKLGPVIDHNVIVHPLFATQGHIKFEHNGIITTVVFKGGKRAYLLNEECFTSLARAVTRLNELI
jgi:hypothetical protein